MPEDSPITVSRTIHNGGRNSNSNPFFGRWTFEYPPARRFVQQRLRGDVLNACAGRVRLCHDGAVHRNDLNPEIDADTHVDVANITEEFTPESFDTVVFDPPYDDLQAADKYDSLRADDVLAAFDGFGQLLRPGGRVLSFGWNSWGMTSVPAFEREETVLFQRGPCKRDVIATVDRRTAESITDYR